MPEAPSRSTRAPTHGPQSHRSSLARLVGPDLLRHRSAAGLTIVELLVILAIISILALIIMPRVLCMIEKSHMTKMVAELQEARQAVETYELELGKFPASLVDAFASDTWPEDLVYCTASNDPNKGHGNEWCTFFDSGNPSGNNNHGGTPGVGFILATPANLAPNCQNVNFVYTSCCGREPTVVNCGDDVNIGHPGRGPFKGSECENTGPGGGPKGGGPKGGGPKGGGPKGGGPKGGKK